MGNEISSSVKRDIKQGNDVKSSSYPERTGVRGKQLPIKGQSLAQDSTARKTARGVFQSSPYPRGPWSERIGVRGKRFPPNVGIRNAGRPPHSCLPWNNRSWLCEATSHLPPACPGFMGSEGTVNDELKDAPGGLHVTCINLVGAVSNTVSP